jgi:hypothetical protein
MKRFFSAGLAIIAAAALMVTIGCQSSTTGPGNNTAVHLVDTALAGTVDQTLSFSGGISVSIPAGAVPAGSHLTVDIVDPAKVPADTDKMFLGLFDVSIDTLKWFAKPITLTVPYDTALVAKTTLGKCIGCAWYNESLKHWSAFEDVVIDSVAHKVTVTTNHLCKLGAWGWANSRGFTDFSSSLHFQIYWKEGEPLDNAHYNSPYKSVDVGPEPFYIQDILYYLEQAYTAYQKLGFQMPSGLVTVQIQDISPDDGRTSFLGTIRINTTVKGDGSVAKEEVLPTVCCHELLHYIQDYYYVQLFSDYTSKWWLEATATQGDNLVYPKATYHEAMQYANGSLGEQLQRSWDDCLADPNWYVAGGFLTYLSVYRPSKLASIPSLLVMGGTATNVSWIRTIVDSYLKDSLASKGIGQEYHDYIKWAYEGKGAITLHGSQPPLSSQNQLFVKTCFLKSASPRDTFPLTVPYLAVKTIKVRNSDTEHPNIVAAFRSASLSAIADVYVVNKAAGSVWIDSLYGADSVSIAFPDTLSWCDIMIVNRSKDYDASIKAVLYIDKEPGISALEPSKIKTGDTLRIVGRNFGLAAANGQVQFTGATVSGGSVVKWQPDTIKLIVPSNAQTGPLKVVVSGTASNAVTLTVNPPTPQIDSITSSQGKGWGIPGSSPTVYGKNFGDAYPKKGKVLLNGAPIPDSCLNSWGDKQFQFRVPAGISGQQQVKVVSVTTGDTSAALPYFSGVPLSMLQSFDSVQVNYVLFVNYMNPITSTTTTAIVGVTNAVIRAKPVWAASTMTVDCGAVPGSPHTGTVTAQFTVDGATTSSIVMDVAKASSPKVTVKATLTRAPLLTWYNPYGGKPSAKYEALSVAAADLQLSGAYEAGPDNNRVMQPILGLADPAMMSSVQLYFYKK